MKLFLAGEGVNELGDWERLPQHRRSPPVRGILEALLESVSSDGWSIEGAIKWSAIRKFRPGNHNRPEVRNILGAALRAKEAGCDALVFVRDSDGDSNRRD